MSTTRKVTVRKKQKAIRWELGKHFDTLPMEKQLEAFQAIPVMHDAQTTMKNFVAGGGVAHDISNKVIIDRSIVSNLYGDVQVLKLRQAGVEETQKGFDSMKEDIDAIALVLREGFAREIDLGQHSNRTLGAVVTGYLRDYLRIRALTEVGK